MTMRPMKRRPMRPPHRMSPVWLAAVALPGCALFHRGPQAGLDPLAGPLARADSQWAHRAEPAGMDAVTATLDSLRIVAPEDPRVLARLARLHWTLGELAEDRDNAVDQYETGRSYGYTCLLTYPAFASGVAAARWRVGSAAVGGLEADAVPCLTWTAANGISLVVTRGAGAALEIEQARPLAERALTLAPEGEGGMVLWAAGMSALLDGDPARVDDAEAQHEAARTLLRRAMEISPTTLLFRADMAAQFPDTRAELLPLPPSPDLDPAALENARARQRARLLEGEPPPVTTPAPHLP